MFKEEGSLLTEEVETPHQLQSTYYVADELRPVIESIDEDAIVPINEHLSTRQRLPNWTLIKILLIVVADMQKRAQALDIGTQSFIPPGQ